MNEQDRGRQIGAIILIAIGVIFLLGPLNFNWWAIFIALPGVMILWNVYQDYTRHGGLESNDVVRGVIGLFLVGLAGSFLFDLNIGFLGNLWPLALIALGLVLLFGRRTD
ncbi:MAG: hypothetical protein JW910_07440 [Anaerolineae bacterium]|nr:hypothetical protein [Anaerolineae bacterium]